MNVSINATEEYLYKVQKVLWNKHRMGISESLNALYPLSYYITTGRASAEFIKGMYDVKPYVMARVLARGYDAGSVDDVIAAIKKKVFK